MLTNFKFTLYQFPTFSTLQLLCVSSSGISLPMGKNDLKESMILFYLFFKKHVSDCFAWMYVRARHECLVPAEVRR